MASSPALESCGKQIDEEEDRKNERIQRGQWIRAAILGANDGLLSTTSLMLGVGAAKEDKRSMVLSGLAGALAGACSMAVGEFVSVSTQRDIEKTSSSGTAASCKLDETDIKYTPEKRPAILSPVRSPMMKVISENALKLEEEYEEDKLLPNPLKAAAASGVAFLFGSFVPLVPAIIVDGCVARMVVIVVVASVALAVFGGFGAQLGGVAG
ncbi:putative Vacuolar iron transporter family protein [Melia azedarach]|uniref:Vacuolar iron transporter family protein n=1 Tax=Melia azedarach TaxID=155640 RepID=A0ACC1YLA6_MELAZ|nr:putative Vacuolar iron transporter family protein [Melia azedarach]